MDTETFVPKTIEEATEIKNKFGNEVAIIAGGTDLMVYLARGTPAPAKIMDITRIPELCEIRFTDNKLFIGSCVTFTEISENDLVAKKAPLLSKCASKIGSRQIRNRATLGGNIATSSPASDSLPALLVHSASIELISKSGKRIIPVSEFNPSYRKTVIDKNEIILGVIIPPVDEESYFEFYKVGTRKAQAISKITLACAGKINEGKFQNICFSAGSVAPTAILLKKTSSYVEGKKVTTRVIERARQHATMEASPIDDIRSTSLYRKTVLGNLVAKFLLQLKSQDEVKKVSQQVQNGV